MIDVFELRRLFQARNVRGERSVWWAEAVASA